MTKSDKKSLRIVFMGTPDFGVPSLDMLLKENYNLIAVITQPDRPAGRGHKLTFPPVKQWATEHGVPVYQFDKISSEGADALRELKPDLCITAAFGQILSQEILDIPTIGIFNIHASLLPKYRGSAPIQWAIINGETVTGVTIMKTVKALDSGDIIATQTVQINEKTDAGALYELLSNIAPGLLNKVIKSVLDGTISYTPQNEKEASYYPMFTNKSGLIDFSMNGKNIVDFVRGTRPFPGSFFYLDNMKIKVLDVSFIKQYKPGTTHSTVVNADRQKGLCITCADGIIKINKFQVPGKKPVAPEDFFLGNSIKIGIVLENNI